MTLVLRSRSCRIRAPAASLPRQLPVPAARSMFGPTVVWQNADTRVRLRPCSPARCLSVAAACRLLSLALHLL